MKTYFFWKDQEIGGWRGSTVGNALVLHKTDLGSISNSAYHSPSMLGVISEQRWSKPWAALSVVKLKKKMDK